MSRLKGTKFPRYSLKQLIEYLDPIVAKTQFNTISLTQLNVGVFDYSSTSGQGAKICAALKLFNLLEGPNNNELKATSLCKTINAKDGEEQQAYLLAAIKEVEPFLITLQTFHSNTVNKDKIAKYAVAELGVNHEIQEEFATVFIESCQVAGLCDENDYLREVIIESTINGEPVKEEKKERKPIVKSPSSTVSVGDKINKGSATTPSIRVNINIDNQTKIEKVREILDVLRSYELV